MMEAQDMFDSKSEASECTQRVLREIREINRNPVPYLDVFPSEQRYTYKHDKSALILYEIVYRK